MMRRNGAGRSQQMGSDIGLAAPACIIGANLNTTKSASANAIPGRLAGLVSSVITPPDDGAAPHDCLGQEGQRQDSGRPSPKSSG